jgi:hypothetical protein
VILTLESVDALQNLGAPATAGYKPDGTLHPYPSIRYTDSPDSLTLFSYSDPKPVLAGAIPPGTDPWFLGGFDPFSSLPHIDEEPLPKKLLISYCKHWNFPLVEVRKPQHQTTIF